MSLFRLLLFVAAATLVTLSPARAHSPGESSLTISADQENLEVLVSLSIPSATALLPADAAPLSSATLDAHRPVLLAAAPRVCVLVDAAGVEIAPQRVLVSLFEEHELRVHFLFPPDTRPSGLRMPMLASLGSEAFCVVSDLRQKSPVRAILTSAAPGRALSSVAP